VFVFGFDSRVKTFSPLVKNDALLDSRPCCNRMLLQLVNVHHWLLIKTLPALLPYLVDKRIGRLQVWFDKIRGYVSQQLSGLTRTVCWRVVLLSITFLLNVGRPRSRQSAAMPRFLVIIMRTSVILQVDWWCNCE